MEPMQIALIVLAIAGIWAVVELALTLRRTRGVVDSLDTTVAQLNSTIEEARPMVAKLDGVVDELQPAMAQIEPLLKQVNIATEALSADLIEVNGVLRDVSSVSGAASSASNAVSGIADAASSKVQQLFGKTRKFEGSSAEHVLTEPTASAADEVEGEGDDAPAPEAPVAEPRQYYTYTTTQEPSDD